MHRPIISEYSGLPEFLRDMLRFRKAQQRNFSVLQMTKKLRKVSPTLVSLLLKGERKLTTDRAPELAKLLGLSAQEKQYFIDWIARINGEQPTVEKGLANIARLPQRKNATTHLLKDWINVYVKDAFQLKMVKENSELIYGLLAGVASKSRIDSAIHFLLRHGYLKRSESGIIEIDTPLHSVDEKIPSQKIRDFHKGALGIATKAIEDIPPSKRYANAMILPLDESSYQQLVEIIAETAERLQQFAEGCPQGDALYQVIINLSPTGGVHD